MKYLKRLTRKLILLFRAIKTEVLMTVKKLQYFKGCVCRKEDLYKRFKDGGESGWFAYVCNVGFFYWNTDKKQWDFFTGDDCCCGSGGSGNVYTITFNANGGSNPPTPRTANAGSVVTVNG